MIKIVAILASHNRRELTLRTLEKLEKQVPDGMSLQAVLVDCGSEDGTPEAAAKLGEWVVVQNESSQCYWANAMANAEKIALRLDPEWLLWINDDVDLDADALPRLFKAQVALSSSDRAAVVGSMRDLSGNVSYGGIKFGARISKWAPIRPQDNILEAGAANGNLLLCRASLAKSVGGIDGSFGHSFADFDWTLRLRKSGGRVLVAPGFFGVCERNSLVGSYRDSALSGLNQWRLILGPKGLPPRANARFLRRHGGILWPIIWARPYVSILARVVRGR